MGENPQESNGSLRATTCKILQNIKNSYFIYFNKKIFTSICLKLYINTQVLQYPCIYYFSSLHILSLSLSLSLQLITPTANDHHHNFDTPQNQSKIKQTHTVTTQNQSKIKHTNRDRKSIFVNLWLWVNWNGAWIVDRYLWIINQ